MNETIHKLIVSTFETPNGKKLLKHLKDTLYDRPVYQKGLTFEEVAFREGQRDVIKQILKEIE